MDGDSRHADERAIGFNRRPWHSTHDDDDRIIVKNKSRIMNMFENLTIIENCMLDICIYAGIGIGMYEHASGRVGGLIDWGRLQAGVCNSHTSYCRSIYHVYE